MLQKTRKIIEIDGESYQVCIGFNLSRELYGCDEIYKTVIIPHLIDIDVESVDWRQTPRYIYKQIEEKCFQIISEGES